MREMSHNADGSFHPVPDLQFSASFLAGISVRSPRKMFTFISGKIFYGSKYPKTILFVLEKGSAGAIMCNIICVVWQFEVDVGDAARCWLFNSCVQSCWAFCTC